MIKLFEGTIILNRKLRIERGTNPYFPSFSCFVVKNLSGVLFTGSVAGVVLFSLAPGLGASAMLTLDSVGRNILLYIKNRLALFLPGREILIAAINGLHDTGTLVMFALASLHRPPPEFLQ